MSIEWIVPLVSVGSLGILVHYLKLVRAPAEHVRGVFGLNPLIPNPKHSSGGGGDRMAVTGLRAASSYTTPITVVGHRGAADDAPENSLAAFKYCAGKGCNFVEFDVALTKDNVPVVLHDDDLWRVAGIRRKIRDMTWEECNQVDLSRHHPEGKNFPLQRIPSLEETIDLMLQLNMKFFIDLKDTNPTVVNAVCDAFARNPALYKRAIVSSFRVKAIYDVRRRDPNIVGSLAWRPHTARYKTWTVDNHVLEHRFPSAVLDRVASWVDFWDERLLHWFQWWFLGISVVLLHKDATSRRDLHTWANRGIHVFLWTVNDPVEKEHIRKNMHCNYMTDSLNGEKFQNPCHDDGTFEHPLN